MHRNQFINICTFEVNIYNGMKETAIRSKLKPKSLLKKWIELGPNPLGPNPLGPNTKNVVNLG